MSRVIPVRNKSLLRTIGLCEQFMLAAAVLIFVFPILDTIIVFGARRITIPLILYTVTISGVFFAGAVCMGVLATKREEEDL